MLCTGRIVAIGFQSTLPTRGSDSGIIKYCANSNNFNPRSPRGGATLIAVHRHKPRGISIHAPHEGERHRGRLRLGRTGRFQSTLPTRGSDTLPLIFTLDEPYFNPRSPRGGATGWRIVPQGQDVISIHAPHEGERL